jgi:integrase
VPLIFPPIGVSRLNLRERRFVAFARDNGETQMRLTDISIKALKPNGQGASIYYDDTITGFGVRVSAGGTKSYILTHGARRQRETIGRVGVLTLQEARAEAKRLLAEYTLGREKPQPISWSDALEKYLGQIAATRKTRTHNEYAYMLRRNVRYGDMRVSDISPHDVRATIDGLAHSPAVQHRTYTILRAFLRWAHRNYYLDRNPMERMQAPRPCAPRDRVLTNDELKRVWHAAGDDTFGRIVKLLILTGQRRGEITGLTGAMVGEDTITLPATHTKNSRLHVFPLGTMAKAILNPPKPKDAVFFRARGKTTAFDGWSTAKPKLDRRCGVSAWRLHDLRRTFASGLASLGVQLPVIERLLNHVSGSFGGIVGVYQRYDYMPEMRDAIVRWERHVAEIISH